MSGAPCVGGKCVAKSNGETCAADGECASGECWDGVCCHTRCDAVCSACDNAGKIGTCSVVAGLPHVDPRRKPCGKDRDCANRCDGRIPWQCDVPAPMSGVACGKDTCIDGLETHAGTCDGVETCIGAKKTCSPYVCDLTTCKTKCAANTDCAAGFVCGGTTCVAAPMDAGVDVSMPDASLPDTSTEPDTSVSDTSITVDTATIDPAPQTTDDTTAVLYGCSAARTTSSPCWLALLLLLRRRR